jgi:response regulator RpfG family c-di-GMP phosphodiesterase
MKINYLVNNTNIGPETTSETIDKGEEFVKQLSEKVSVPVAFTVVMNGLNREPRLFEQLEIKKYMLNPWEVEQ